MSPKPTPFYLALPSSRAFSRGFHMSLDSSPYPRNPQMQSFGRSIPEINTHRSLVLCISNWIITILHKRLTEILSTVFTLFWGFYATLSILSMIEFSKTQVSHDTPEKYHNTLVSDQHVPRWASTLTTLPGRRPSRR